VCRRRAYLARRILTRERDVTAMRVVREVWPDAGERPATARRLGCRALHAAMASLRTAGFRFTDRYLAQNGGRGHAFTIDPPPPEPLRLVIWPDWELLAGAARVRLHGKEGRVMLALLGNRLATEDHLCTAVWPAADDMPTAWAKGLGVLLARLREKLRPLGWTIVGRRGFGWSLAETRATERIAA
jgi:hypothetical protein